MSGPLNRIHGYFWGSEGDERLVIEHRAAALAGRTGRYAKVERAGQVTVDRERERIAMAERNARVLYELALLNSADPTHVIIGDPPPG